MNNTKEFLAPQITLDFMVSELQKGLMNDLYWLLKESNNYDALINIGDSPNIKSFKAHKSVLSARSLYFRAILSNNQSNGRNSMIEITQTSIQPDIFDVVLKFIYTGSISFENVRDVKVLFDYIIAAEKLWLYQLIQYVENYLIYQKNDWLKSNFIYVLTIVNSNSLSFKLLHEFIDDILKNHTYLLFDSNDFHTIPKNILIQLLQQRKFSNDITEEKIWNIVLNWGLKKNIYLIDKDVHDWTVSDFNKLHNTLQNCIPLIHFNNIPPKIFFNNIKPYKKILSPGLYQKIMQCPTFVNYNKQLNCPKLNIPPPPPRPLISSNNEQKRESFSIPSPLLDAFPKPPSPVSSSINEFILTSSISQSLPRSTVSYPVPKNTERSSDSITTSVTEKSKRTIKEIRSVKENTPPIKENTPTKKPEELLSKISNSVLSTWSSAYTIRGKSRSSMVSVKTSENSLSLIKEKLKRSNSSSKKSDVIVTNSEQTIELDVNQRKLKRRLNRKASIISRSKSTTPMMSIAMIPRLS